jgi:cell wall-associated NlpC family hydrolase
MNKRVFVLLTLLTSVAAGCKCAQTDAPRLSEAAYAGSGKSDVVSVEPTNQAADQAAAPSKNTESVKEAAPDAEPDQQSAALKKDSPTASSDQPPPSDAPPLDGNKSPEAASAVEVAHSAVDEALGDTGDQVIGYARTFLGLAYRFGGTGASSGFDCSGFARHVMQRFGVNLARKAVDQFQQGTPVEKGELQKGDLVFFTTYRAGASHVGIYIGANRFIHSPSTGKTIRIDSLDDIYYWKPRYLGARRVLS